MPSSNRIRRGAARLAPLACALAATMLLSTPLAASRRAARVEMPRPRGALDCDTPLGHTWYGSTERCLRELCAGENVTNAYVSDGHGRLRTNPCYGRGRAERRR
jgi:hypothetical protein